MTEKLIETKNLTFKYAENEEPAIENINFTVNRGEIVFIAGDSGSGKSTLLNIINGIIPEVIEGEMKGDMIIDGKKDLKIYERSLILGNVLQNPRSQFFTTNTTSEMVFEMENYGLSADEMRKRLEQSVEEYRVENLLDREIFRISSGERQFLALVTALIMNPQAVIFDEPSANLDYGNAMRLKEEIKRLKAKGKTVIVADHRCFYLEGIIDKVLLVENKTVKEFKSERDYFHYEYGKRVFNLFKHEFPRREIVRTQNSGVEIKNLSYRGILEDITISFNEGEVTAIIGINGAGKTTLAKIISRVIKPDKGKVVSPGQALYIMQDADFQLFGESCLKELEITEKNGDKNADALKLLDLWRLKEKHPQTLSGGEKQRLQMAISLVSGNDVIILDEPTSGLDKSAMDRVIGMLEILKKGRTMILISHDYEFIRKSTDRIIYVKDTKIEEDFYLYEDNTEKLNKIYKEMESYYE